MTFLAAGRVVEIGGRHLEVVRELATGASCHVYLVEGRSAEGAGALGAGRGAAARAGKAAAAESATRSAPSAEGRARFALKLFLPPSRLGPGAEPVTPDGLAAARVLQRREARRLAGVDHPNIVALVAAGAVTLTASERAAAPGLAPVRRLPALCLSYVDGLPLLPALAAFDLAPRQVLHTLIRLAEALAHLHERRMLHRDVKPANVLLRQADHEPVLLDFGGAGRARSRDVLQLGELIGDVAAAAAPRLGVELVGGLLRLARQFQVPPEGLRKSSRWSARRVANELEQLAEGARPHRNLTGL